MKADLLKIRNDFWESIPTGEVNAFDLSKVIKQHLLNLDVFIDAMAEPSTYHPFKSKEDMLHHAKIYWQKNHKHQACLWIRQYLGLPLPDATTYCEQNF